MNEVWGITEETQQQMQSVTVEDLTKLVETLRGLDDEKKALETKVDELNPQINKLKKDIQSILDSHGLDNFRVPNVGLVYTMTRQSFETPKTPEDKQRLFNYIESKHGADTLNGMLSIHSATLNKFAKDEYEAGANDIPGLGLPSYNKTVGLRRA